jgi:dCMP deaminase
MTEKELRYHQFYMGVAFLAAQQLSFAKKRKVGAVAVSEGNIIGYGFNGTPAGEPNECEDEHGNTLPSVIHAEHNLLKKLRPLKKGFDIYVTKEPCINCADMLAGAYWLNKVYFRENSKSQPNVGVDLLLNAGIPVIWLPPPGDAKAQGTSPFPG